MANVINATISNQSSYINTNLNNYTSKTNKSKNYDKFQGPQNISKKIYHSHHSQFAKLLDNNLGNSPNLTSTLPSNSNNFFASPTLSVKLNRRHSHDDSIFKRIKYRLVLFAQILKNRLTII